MRKSFVVTVRVLVPALVLFAIADCAHAAEKLTKIADGVYAYVDTKDSSTKNSFGANAGVIVGKNGIVVVDTLMSAKEAKRFIKDIRAVSKKPIKYVVNTHYHLDHAFGNSEFAKLGAIVIAQENDKKAMAASAEDTLKNIASYGLTPKDMEGTKASYPVIAYGDRMSLDIGGQAIELIHARHSHTDGDTLVYLPESKVLFAGDVLFTNYHPFLAEGDIGEWSKELDEIKGMDVDKIIPGHGPVSYKLDLDEMKAYINAFDQKARELAAGTDDVPKIVTAIQAALPPRPEGAWLIGANIQMKYLKK